MIRAKGNQMTDRDNPTAYEDLGPTPALTCSAAPSPNKPPSEVRRLIGELGLRYRPSAQADLEAHAGAIALLCRDLADVPPRYLEQAIRKWVRESHFMPKASELIELAQSFLPKNKKDPSAWIENGNRGLAEQGRFDVNWVHDKASGQYRIEPIE
jgi:hypothetical protein